MSDVKWIKIMADIFNDDKIMFIEEMPEADSIIVIWFKLLCLAGIKNNSGVFMFQDTIPYTEKMLATVFRRKESTVKLALEVFEQFGMIEIVNGAITIPNWGKYQNFDKLEQKTEYMRNYMREYREKQKQIACNSNGKTNSKSNSKANVSEADKKREEKEEDKIRDSNKRFTPPTLEEVTAYCFERGNNVDPQRFIDYYTSNGWMVGRNKMKDWQAAVRNWEKKDNDRPAQKPVAKRNDFHNFQQHGYDTAAIERMLDLQDIAEVEAMRKGGG